jgi:hypothetical protein
MPAKMTKRLSNITTERRAPPSSPETLENFSNFRFNMENQRAVRPTNWSGQGDWTTTNSSGRSAVMGGVGTAAGGGGMVSPRNDPGATKV